jgi:hypothetical protein
MSGNEGGTCRASFWTGVEAEHDGKAGIQVRQGRSTFEYATLLNKNPRFQLTSSFASLLVIVIVIVSISGGCEFIHPLVGDNRECN